MGQKDTTMAFVVAVMDIVVDLILIQLTSASVAQSKTEYY